MSCVGAARCEQSCYDEARAHRQVINTFLDDIHRPALPYKFKFKFSGCANDCMNSIQRSDMAVIGTWRDNMRTDEALARKWFAKHGMNELVNDVITRCPTKTIMLKEIKDVDKATASRASRSATPTRSRSTTATACAACTASTS
jgi:dissimilatory sulfite reductase alpha subunit